MSSRAEANPNSLNPSSAANRTDAEARRGRRSPEPSATAFVDSFPAHVRLHQVETHQENRYQSTWRRDCHPNPRPQSPALPWHKEYSQLDPKCGRVLVIDFVRADQSQHRKRRVVAQELTSLDSLKKLYQDPRRGQEANLRLLHVQNAPWATKYLLRKFNIDGRDDLVSSTFAKYARSTKPDMRGGKPFPNAKTWRVQHDPWRGISKTSFGFEYLKEYRVQDPTTEGRTFDEKMMELNGYDEEENPAYAYDVSIQRLACYIQHKEDSPTPPLDGLNGISNPYRVEANGNAAPKKHKEWLPQLSSLDNENAIIIFENSQSGSFEDCLISARSEWETHWRRLPFYLAYEAREIVGNDDLLGRQCARMILDDVFRALVARWETLVDICEVHVSILEDKIYEQPADETRAPELWKNSSLWLQLEKLTTSHMAVVRDMRVRLRELVADITIPVASTSPNSEPATLALLNDDDWLEEIPGDFDRVASAIEEDLTKPTQSLISLLYQSVSIRDSRLSLQLNTSMWRLSWITFIFLPLTFMVGFFGMNVDTFANNPSLKWYFIVTVPFMLLVLVGWYALKHILARQRQTPYQRGIYEAFFHDLAVSYPQLWSRLGPRDYVVPRTRLDQWKWWLVKRWTRPERTIKAGQSNADTAAPVNLGSWSRVKQYLIRKWTDDIITFQSKTDVELLDADDETDLEQGSVLAEGLLGATQALTVPGQPVATALVERLKEHKFQQEQQQQQQQQQQQTVAHAEDYGIIDPPTTIVLQPEIDGPSHFVSPSVRIARNLSPPDNERRASSGSPRGRRPASSGAASSGSRNSSVLVEEEDPHWIAALAEEGRGWYWRPRGGSNGSPGGAHMRRQSGGSSRSRPREISQSIDERVGRGGAGGREEPMVRRGASPLGTVTSAADDARPLEHAQSGLDAGGNIGEGASSSRGESAGSEGQSAAQGTKGERQRDG